MGYIEGQDRNQLILFPESIDDYISDDNSVRVIDEYIEQLDMEKGLSMKPKEILKWYGYLKS